MNKRWFLTILFPFLWVMLSGFGPPQEIPVEQKVTKDSTAIVKLQFENPRVDFVVKDQRNMDAVEKIISRIDNADNAVAAAIDNVSDDYFRYMENDRERRYESSLDYLERLTGYDSNTIENFIRQKRLSESIASIVLIVSIIVAYSFILRSTFWRNMDWRVFLTKTVGATALIVLLFTLLHHNLHGILYPDSYRFFTLINLSG